MTEPSWGALWGEWAPGPGGDAFRHHREYLAPLLPRAGRVLDAGCGEGRFARELHSAGCQVTGLDWCHELCATAARRSPWVSFVAGDAGRLPFRDESFDSVVSVMLLQQLPCVLPAMREFGRVLVRGGGLVLAVSHPYSTTLSRLDSGQLVVTGRYGSAEPYSRTAVKDGMSIPLNGFQHSVQEYFSSLREAGFRIDDMREIIWPSTDQWRLVPRYLHITASAL